MKSSVLLACLLVVTMGGAGHAAPGSQPAKAPGSQPTSQPSSQPTTAQAKPSAKQIAGRVADAQARLSKTEPGKRIWASIEAHGGLAHWFEQGPIQFRFDYRPLGEGGHRDSRQLVDSWASRAAHTMPDGKTRFGWDGAQAWQLPADGDTGMKPRFWSLTPFYFIAAPFVFADPGVVLASEGPIEWEGRTYDQVRVTYEAGVGDASGDFYVVYIDQKTNRLGGLRYVVSYPGFFPKGGHSPEKFMAYDGEQTVNGVKLVKTCRTFAWDPEKKTVGKQVTAITLSEVSFLPDTPSAAFAVPAGAKVLEGF